MTDQRVQQIMGHLLRAGVLIAASLAGTGLVWFLAAHGAAPVSFHHAVPVPHDGASRLMLAGLLVLVATPVARVAFAVIAFQLERDRIYVAVALIVLGTLVAGLTAPWW